MQSRINNHRRTKQLINIEGLEVDGYIYRPNGVKFGKFTASENRVETTDW